MSLADRSDRPSPAWQPRDDLTGLLSRGAFMAAMDDALGRAGEGPCLLMLDLDRFKAVNDGFGHPVGDALLRAVAARLVEGVRRGDAVGRLGGDEFALLLAPPIDGRAARRLGGRLIERLSRPYRVEGSVVHVGASVGAALAGPAGSVAGVPPPGPVAGVPPGHHAGALMAQADIALYAAKAAGRGCVRLFGPAMRAAADAALVLQADLGGALARREFSLFYQPLLNIPQNRIEGFEALLRWNHPTLGLVPPARFIPLAEQSGLMPAVGEWALRAACIEAGRWPTTQRLTVNVAASQFRNGMLPAAVAQVLRETGLEPARLELEIPEPALMLAGETGLLRQMEALRGLGVGLALDGFGTGHASLTQLRALPLQRLKIDPSFAGDDAMLRAVQGIGSVLGFAITADGVKTPAQLSMLREHGCPAAQGEWISQPLPVAQLWTACPPRPRLAA